VYVYLAGYPEWKKSGYPVETIDMVLNVEIPRISAADLKARIDKSEAMTIVDSGTRRTRALQHQGSRKIPLEDLMSRYQEIPTDRPVVITCMLGKQGPIAGQYLVKQGYAKVVVLDGGVKNGWAAAGYPLEK